MGNWVISSCYCLHYQLFIFVYIISCCCLYYQLSVFVFVRICSSCLHYQLFVFSYVVVVYIVCVVVCWSYLNIWLILCCCCWYWWHRVRDINLHKKSGWHVYVSLNICGTFWWGIFFFCVCGTFRWWSGSTINILVLWLNKKIVWCLWRNSLIT